MWIEGTNYPDLTVSYDKEENDLEILDSKGNRIKLTASQIVELAEGLNKLIRNGELPS